MNDQRIAEIQKRSENAKDIGLTGAHMAAAVFDAYCEDIPYLLSQLAERDTEIEQLREAQRWVPVAERLPEEPYTPEKAIAAWNRRTQPENEPLTLDELLCTADWCKVCDQTTEDGTCMAMEQDRPLNRHCAAAGLRWLRQPREVE